MNVASFTQGVIVNYTLELRESEIYIYIRARSEEKTCYIYISRQSLVLTLK